MSDLALPVLFLNMGGEMMYIVEQRLTAQGVPGDRAAKVLHEIMETMLKPDFIDTLFTPQDLHSKHSIKELFDKLAHSSIMKLNVASMAKLYDLMTMAVKHQVCLVRTAPELLFVTLNHLYSIYEYIKMNATVKRLWDGAVSKFLNTYEHLKVHQWIMIRRCLMNFFQNDTTRVSIFLKENIQNQNGKFKYNLGGPLDVGLEIPGIIKTYGTNGKLKRVSKFTVDEQYALLQNRPSVTQKGDKLTKLGLNMYTNKQAIETQKVVNKTNATNMKSDIDSYKSDPKSRHQLNLLSKLLSSKEDKTNTNFKLNLFQSDVEESKAEAQAPIFIVEEPDSKVIMIDASKNKKSDALNQVMAELHTDDSQASNDQEFNLLDLMDNI